jgi:hypothetical protein
MTRIHEKKTIQDNGRRPKPVRFARNFCSALMPISLCNDQRTAPLLSIESAGAGVKRSGESFFSIIFLLRAGTGPQLVTGFDGTVDPKFASAIQVLQISWRRSMRPLPSRFGYVAGHR